MKHIIGKQIIDLQINTDVEAHSLQQTFSQMYWQEIVPAMSMLFDELSGTDEVTKIDRLEIDLGNLSTMELQKDVILPLLKNELEKWFQQNKVEYSNLKRTPIRKSVFEKWIFFLVNGYLPWSMTQLPENCTTNVLDSLASNAQAIHRLRSELSKSTYARKRLVQQHDSIFLHHIIETFTAKKQSKLIPFVETLTSDEAKESFWHFAIEKTIVEENKIGDSKILQVYHEQITNDLKTVEPSTKFEMPKDEKVALLEDGIFVQNAGIILLHPFLTRFFKHCNLLDGNEFKDQEAVSKAIHLLHYMATQTEQPDEQDLSLLKFLCGIPFNVPIKKFLQLSDEEKEEADTLMQAAIEHWGALGAVSNASLQETFLQREGKLKQTQSGWQLQIEKKTVDILLNQLPWNISVIKLPWMKEFIKIDWI